MSKSLLAVALKKLSSRAYSQKELEKYLAKRNFSQAEIKEAITKLQSWGYLNDQKLAMDWYMYYTNNKPHGYLYIYKKLQAKGISAEVISSLLEDYDQEKELERARGLAEKFIANKAKQTQQDKLKGMLARHLYRKGFLQVNIMKILVEFFPDTI
ncbi:MAG TPA: regulatory protein RecX [Clostridia bacterium]|jgi:regulatory protein|nr:regulatory protein RecX [Clostridia bacterium]HHY06532.1 regulatory protein RecX [Clostridia bacterium]